MSEKKKVGDDNMSRNTITVGVTREWEDNSATDVWLDYTIYKSTAPLASTLAGGASREEISKSDTTIVLAFKAALRMEKEARKKLTFLELKI